MYKTLKKHSFWLGIIGFCVLFFGSFYFFSYKIYLNPKDTDALSWHLLSELDYKTGEGPPKLKELHEKEVRIPGFVVPLSDKIHQVAEFLLVPNAMACIHIPPPPPNLMIHIILKEVIDIRKVGNPVWVKGILRIQTVESIYGYASYQIEAQDVRAYKEL